MKKTPVMVTFLSIGILMLLLFSPSSLTFVRAFQNGQNAAIVIGQPNFTTNTTSVSQTSISGPEGMAFDSSGNLWAADASGRVVKFAAPLTTGESASVVLGQPDFTTHECRSGPAGLCVVIAVAFDSSGDLWATDPSNNRVLEFKPPFVNGGNASIVIGYADFFSTSSNLANASSLYDSFGIAFDSSGNLWVADNGYSRVLRFNTPFSNGESASLVLGQQNFTGNFTVTTQSSIGHPGGITFDSSGNLWVSDRDNRRVLKFAPPFSTGESASLVLGTTDFVSSGAGFFSSSAFYAPQGLAFDHSGNLWVADSGKNRVLGFAPPFVTGENASYVIGQSNFTGALPSTSASGLFVPIGVAVDAQGNLWIGDSQNNRVVEYLQSVAQVSSSSTSTSSSSSSTSSATTLSTPSPPVTTASAAPSQATSTSSSAGLGGGATSTSPSSSATALPLSYVVIPIIVLIVGVTLLVGSVVRKKSSLQRQP
ncbi:MAG: NHL repeat-containing protein [Thaumarchaeota archaeon]|nr:NHL repeat-containing protein [Nitrososphaerota archaeon]